MGLVSAAELAAANAVAELIRDLGGPPTYGQVVLAVARSQVGVREVSPNEGPEVDQYIRASGGSTAGDPAWCMSFVYWCHRTAARAMNRRTTCPKTGGAAKGWIAAGKGKLLRMLPVDVIAGRAVLEPGDVMVQSRIDRGRGGALTVRGGGILTGHAGVVARHLPGEVGFATVEGNTNDLGGREGEGVYDKVRGLDDPHLVGFYRPDWA